MCWAVVVKPLGERLRENVCLGMFGGDEKLKREFIRNKGKAN